MSLLNIIKNKIMGHYTYDKDVKYNFGINNDKDVYEKKFTKINKKLLKKFENKKLNLKKIKRKNIKNMKIKNNEIEYLINDFIQLYNENNENKINFQKKTLGIKLNLNDKDNIYFISFFSDFENFVHAKYFNIFFICITNDFNIKDKILFVDIIGSLGKSDVLVGNYSKNMKGQFINIFKDKPLEFILNQNKINELIENRENPTLFKYERGIPELLYKTIDPFGIDIGSKKFKLNMNGKCLNQKNGKIILDNCENSQKYTYQNKNIINDDGYCLTYHKKGDLSFTPCKITENCSKDNKINNCKTIKIRKYGSLEFKNMDKCLNSKLELSKCYKTDKISLL
tara:strand:- start:2791 stop:3810 length:1020 start_codon:yes stop_codon:yes gene_type:complete